jgi:signal recognition particle subunit SRP54
MMTVYNLICSVCNYYLFLIQKELDHPDAVKLFKKQTGRSSRVARGAGVSIRDVNDLLVRYSTFAKKIGGILGVANKRGNMTSNVNVCEKVIDPRILNQMGKFER